MKKTLLALATLASFAGAASAQSSGVTLYGRVDMGITKQNDGTTTLPGGNGATGAAGDRWDVRQGSSSRLGVRVVEDLGGGLNAGAVLEHRFNPDTGTQQNATVFWNGRSYVELGTKSVGTVYLGRDYIPAYWIADSLDPFGGDTVGRIRDDILLRDYRVDGDVRSNNTVGFRSADFSGFALQAAVSAGEGTRTVPANKRTVGINAKYAAGPLFVGLAYDGANGDNNVVVGGASWDFGVVKPMLSYAQTEALETTGSTAGNKLKDKTWAVGATAPIGAGRLKAVYARVKRDNNLAGLSDWHLNRVGLGYEYSLSKRTSLYADVGSAKQSHANTLAGAEPTRTTGFDAGIKHSF